MTFEQTGLDFIFFRLNRHLEVKSAQRKPPDIFIVRRLAFVAQDKYLFLDAPAHRHNREGQCIGFLFIDELFFMENIIVIARKMLVKFFRKKKLPFLLDAESLYEYRRKTGDFQSMPVL